MPTAPALLDLITVHGPWLLFLLAILETSFVTGLVVPSGVATSLATVVALELSGRRTYGDAKASLDVARRMELYDQSNQRHTFAVVIGATGVALIGTGVALWLTRTPSGPSRISVVPHVGADGAGIAIHGALR